MSDNMDGVTVREDEVVCNECHLTHYKCLDFCPNCEPEEARKVYRERCQK